ncbi:MAG: hypothetical protein IKF78_13705 [Atopobiaceae bacterium]|nr:hypothetical protein [Atopobiaceae bacterium]
MAVDTGLREGETRVTLVFGKDENQVLHDWADTTGRTLHEIAVHMVGHYIEDVIRPAAKEKGGLTCPSLTTPPDEYADLYKGWHNDEWAEFF